MNQPDSGVTRRSFVAGAVSAAACAWADSPSGIPTSPLSVFRYSDVQLLPGPLKAQFDQNHLFFLNLSEDRLLKIYRQRAGLLAPGENMGGWYDYFCPGASFGQYVSALARFGAATGSEPTHAKVKRLVAGYAQTIDPTGKFFDDLRYPAYTYDKLVLALLDAQALSDDRNAIAILHATTQAAQPHMPDHALTPEEKRTRHYKNETYEWDESYTLAENLFLAYKRTGDRQFFDMGKRYLLDRTFFDPLSEGQNVLPGLHAYSHMNALSSGMQGYFQLGDRKYLRAVTNAVDWIWADQSFATGGWGPNEAFVEPGQGKLGASISTTHRSFETPCGSYAHFKVMRYLLSLTADPRYGDSMEQVLYNTVLGAKPIQENGASFYYSDYAHTAHKAGIRIVADSPWPWDHDGRWPCCSGTLPMVASDYGISAYFRAADGIYVNLYVPSRLRWNLNGSASCTLEQRTDYPIGNLVSLRVNPSSPQAFSLYLRVPAWAGANSSVSVNGKRVTIKAGTFHKIHRTWKSGDLVELELDQRIGMRAVDKQTADQVALVRGPLVLFAITKEQPTLERAKLAHLQVNKAERNSWSFETAGGSVALRPFYGIGDEIYQTYWKVV